MPYIYSGVCLAAMFGSIIYEHQRMKREESKLREAMRNMAEEAGREGGYPDLAAMPAQAMGLA